MMAVNEYDERGGDDLRSSHGGRGGGRYEMVGAGRWRGTRGLKKNDVGTVGAAGVTSVKGVNDRYMRGGWVVLMPQRAREGGGREGRGRRERCGVTLARRGRCDSTLR